MTALTVTGSHYSDEQRREAVAHFIVTGNMRRVSELTGIPHSTLLGWKNSDWWHTLIVKVRAEKESELDARFTEIIHRGIEQVLDRIENGDYVMVNGQLKRKPVSAKDLGLITAITFDKRQIIRNCPTEKPGNSDKLQEIADRLAGLAKPRVIEMDMEEQ
ncbi:MAG TPA: hypothetical protein PLK99_08090 [Burkholderiales bacterium]|nr:hypothetical protein [Burkholderiales bacterium]